MISVLYVVLNLLAVLSLKSLAKSVSRFEMICNWNFISILGQEFFVIVSLNMELIKNVDDKMYNILVALNRAVLIPILIMWFLIWLNKSKSTFTKCILVLSSVLVLSGIEYMGNWLGLISHTQEWSVWWTASEWSGILLFSIVFSIIVQRLYKKEVVS